MKTTVAPSLAVISTVNASEAELEAFLSYHLRSPDIAMIVFLDLPEHVSFECVSRFADRVTFVACTPEHWEAELGKQPENMPQKQHTNIRAGARMAREMGLNWAISIDNDEFLYPLSAVPGMIERHAAAGVDTIKIRPRETVHSRRSGYEGAPFSTDCFRVLYGTNREYLSRIRRLRGLLRLRLLKQLPMTRRGYWGHTDGKSAFNLDAPVTEFKQHNQFSDERKLTRGEEDKVIILHYDAINYTHWKKKWWRRTFGQTKATAISDKRARLTNLTKLALRLSWLGADRFFFNWLYVFSDAEIDTLIEHGIFVRFDTGMKE